MRLAGGSGLALLLAMFLPWYGSDTLVELPGGSEITAEGANFNAWESFALIDLLLFVVAVLAIVFALAPERGLPPIVVTAAGALAVLVVFYRLVDPPSVTGGLVGAVEAETGRRIGVLVGLLTSLGITVGGYLELSKQGGR